MTAGRLLAGAAVLAAAGWIGWTTRASWRSADRLEQRLQRRGAALEDRTSTPAPGGDLKHLDAAVARQLRTAHQGAEALGRIQERLDTLTASVAATAAPPPAPAPTADQLAAASAARALISRSVEQGRWTEDSRREMARFLNDMDRDARDELARALIAAVNAGKLALEGPIL